MAGTTFFIYYYIFHLILLYYYIFQICIVCLYKVWKTQTNQANCNRCFNVPTPEKKSREVEYTQSQLFDYWG